jgi:hypothetical protein
MDISSAMSSKLVRPTQHCGESVVGLVTELQDIPLAQFSSADAPAGHYTANACRPCRRISRSAAFRGSPIKASISENRKNFGCYRPAFCSASREAVK